MMLLNYPHHSPAAATLAEELQRQPQANPRQTNQNPSTASISQTRSSFPSLSRVLPQFFLVNKMKRFWGESRSPLNEEKGRLVFCQLSHLLRKKHTRACGKKIIL
ncbi:hypothetical protein Drorol1_Dr00002731 [Drosera rotundifolia]